MSQTTVEPAQDQWQKGQVTTSHPVRDITRKYVDVDDGEFGELVVWGYDPGNEVRQPRETAFSENDLAYTVVDEVCTVTSVAHGLEVGETAATSNDSATAITDGSYEISATTDDTFSFAVPGVADSTGTPDIDIDVAAFTIADVAGILSKSTTGGRAKDFRTGALTISTDDPVTVLQEGDIAVELVATVSAQDDAHYDASAKGFRGDTTGDAVKVPGKLIQAGVSGDIVMMRFNLDATLGS